MNSMKKLANKVKSMNKQKSMKSGYVGLNGDGSVEEEQESTPTGFVAIYVGEDRTRFVIPTGHLSHPLFKMLLEKAENEFGFDQQQGLMVPCTVAAFQQVVVAIETSHRRFDFGDIVEEFIVNGSGR
ncbi:auxin-responsive protein SAUR15-like [Impatiens glandulifera]|uniref:auxin-responsive protein SAUR15-like n=1 Tax=Impatiens glandulifera TaxID=253017 RepID=UPI001FB0E27F|nr:auxin-responsive protein SAUR15-like [Impatiens glandulifera]